MKVIQLSDDVTVHIDECSRVAVLKVGGWESLVDYDEAREITTDSAAVATLRRIGEV